MLDTWKRNGRKAVERDDYHAFMMRELLVWVVGVPVPIAMVIGLFVF
ncbi:MULTISPECIES: hypothetical protein [unclassified Rhizobium]|nr:MULTISPECIES: hypothetical protein [unclassified Rhizobium]